MNKIFFEKHGGDPSLEILFFWKMTVDSDSREPIPDRFIPELFFDFFYIQEGEVHSVDPLSGDEVPLGPQTLKTIFTQPLTLSLSPPLTLFGARLSLKFAEIFWEAQVPSSHLLAQDWVAPGQTDLAAFARQVTRTIRARCTRKTPAPMLSPTMEESEWLSHFSARHKRRLYRAVFGISKKEMRAIQGLHAFLGQNCDFSSESPRIIAYIDAEVFYDQPHFNRQFRKLTDLSPLEYLQASSILQDNLMAASYNEAADQRSTMQP